MALESKPPPVYKGARDRDRVSGGLLPNSCSLGYFGSLGAYQFQSIWTEIAQQQDNLMVALWGPLNHF